MADDLFQDLLELEDEFYREGYEAGVTDSKYAGLIEGKVFGIEKGYEKALDLAKMHGRAMVWNIRLAQPCQSVHEVAKLDGCEDENRGNFVFTTIGRMSESLSSMPVNSRLHKHVDALLTLTNGTDIRTDNDDEAVTEFDERLAKAKAKAKVVANIAGELLNPGITTTSGIEDATGLNARH